VLRRLPGARTLVASRAGGALVADGGLTFGDLVPLRDISACDLLCVPGGYDLTGPLADSEYLSELRRLGRSAQYLTSVCTGSLLLAATGLLNGKRVACHWASRHLLELGGAIADSGRVVRDGHIISGGGVTAGIDFALTVAAEIAGETVAQTIQLALEYNPAPPYGAGAPELAPKAVVALVRERVGRIQPEVRAALSRACAATIAQPLGS
jgi:cyclohexyl-isocyanide hydratase